MNSCTLTAQDLITHLLDVDPEKRYTIDEFLAHPWCNGKPTPFSESASPSPKTLPKYLPLESPILAPGGRRGMPSPGIATLKETFDVTYAVHRMEEEGAKRRAYNGPGGAGKSGFLHNLNEEEGEDDDEVNLTRYGIEVSHATESQGQASDNVTNKKETDAQIAYQGRGGADCKMGEAALYDGRAGPRDRGRQSGRKTGFELTLDNATLLGRRKVSLVSPVASI